MRSLFVLPSGSESMEAATRSATDAACRVIEVSRPLRELVAALGMPATGADPQRERLVSALILDESRIAETLSVGMTLPRDKRLAAPCGALAADPSSTRTLDERAPQVGASARTLARLLVDELETTFATWRRQMRLAHAGPPVARGRPLSRVAAKLGYSTARARSPRCSSRFGKSPSAFFARDDAGAPRPRDRDVEPVSARRVARPRRSSSRDAP